MRKAFFIASTGVCFFIFLFSACSKKEQIILISTSGISDWLSPETRNNSGFAVLKKAIEKEKQYSIVLDMGNWLTTIPEGRITKANAIIDCMNNVGYSLAMIGNNDLSFPPENFNKILNESEFSLLASNIYLKTGDRPKHTKPHHIVKLQKTSIGIFSINTFDPENLSSAKTLPFYRLEKENYEITRNVKTLLDNGSKIIIMLLNFNSLKNDFHLKEFYKCIASGNYAPDIVIANGLTLEKQLKINRTYFINQGKESSIVLRTQISINPKTGKSSGISSKTISLNKDEFGEDLEVLKIETGHIKKISDIFDKKIGSANETLEKSETGISSLANWIALCMKKWSRAEGAIISANKLKGDISKGPISKKDIYELLDYNTHIVYLKLRGDSLKTIITSNLDKGLGLAGIALSMKNNAVNEIRIRDKRLNPAKIYQIVIPDYMLNEEEYAILPHAIEFVNKPKSITEILKWQLRRNKSPVTGHTQDTNNNR